MRCLAPVDECLRAPPCWAILEIDPIAHPFNLELESEAIAAEAPKSLVTQDPLVRLVSGEMLAILQRHGVARCSPDGQLFFTLPIPPVSSTTGPLPPHAPFPRRPA